MAGATVRIREKTKILLQELAAETGKPMQTILDLAIDDYRRYRFLQEANEAYAALRKNPKGWKAELSERKEWEATIGDDREDK